MMILDHAYPQWLHTVGHPVIPPPPARRRDKPPLSIGASLRVACARAATYYLFIVAPQGTD